jgi:ABC-2 type transport system ATP-binding protein
MPEAASFYWFFTPREVLRMLGSLSGLGGAALSARIDAVLDAVELSDNADKLIKKFSKGMASRLNAAQAMLHDPEFLILDEPFSGLDPLARIQMRNLLAGLKKGGKTVLLSSHELSEAELICDDICVMKSGGIIKEGPIGAMLKDRSGQSLEKYFMEIISA